MQYRFTNCSSHLNFIHHILEIVKCPSLSKYFFEESIHSKNVSNKKACLRFRIYFRQIWTLDLLSYSRTKLSILCIKAVETLFYFVLRFLCFYVLKHFCFLLFVVFPSCLIVPIFYSTWAQHCRTEGPCLPDNDWTFELQSIWMAFSSTWYRYIFPEENCRPFGWGLYEKRFPGMYRNRQDRIQFHAQITQTLYSICFSFQTLCFIVFFVFVVSLWLRTLYFTFYCVFEFFVLSTPQIQL